LAHKTPSFDTNKLSKVVFDSNSDSKQPKIQRKIHTILWILKISRKKSANQKSCTCTKYGDLCKKKRLRTRGSFTVHKFTGSRYILKSAGGKGKGGRRACFVGLSLIACPGYDRASCKTVQKYPLGTASGERMGSFPAKY